MNPPEPSIIEEENEPRLNIFYIPSEEFEVSLENIAKKQYLRKLLIFFIGKY